MITRLGEVPWLSIMPLCAARALSHEPLDLSRLARERHVTFVVEASLRVDPAGLRVNARLVDAASSASVWSERMPTTVRELPDLHATLAGALVEAMRAARPAPPAPAPPAGDESDEEPVVGHA